MWVDRIKCTSPDYYEYDEQGNLITLSQIVYFYWQNGRELEKVNLVGRDDFNVIDFKYDDEGIRTEKHTGTDVPRTYYTTEEGKITSQYVINANGQKTEEMIFLYDGDELVGARHRGSQYYYLKNAMGDVIGVVNEDGQQIVSYAYNAWGKVVSKNVLVGGADVDYYFARYNPMLYRSYYYDDTLSMYYLQSRYYMPEICRFVNSDIPEIAQQSKDEVNGLNLFAYCNNNPVNNSDPTGYGSSKKRVDISVMTAPNGKSYSTHTHSMITINGVEFSFAPYANASLRKHIAVEGDLAVGYNDTIYYHYKYVEKRYMHYATFYVTYSEACQMISFFANMYSARNKLSKTLDYNGRKAYIYKVTKGSYKYYSTTVRNCTTIIIDCLFSVLYTRMQKVNKHYCGNARNINLPDQLYAFAQLINLY